MRACFAYVYKLELEELRLELLKLLLEVEEDEERDESEEDREDIDDELLNVTRPVLLRLDERDDEEELREAGMVRVSVKRRLSLKNRPFPVSKCMALKRHSRPTVRS